MLIKPSQIIIRYVSFWVISLGSRPEVSSITTLPCRDAVSYQSIYQYQLDQRGMTESVTSGCWLVLLMPWRNYSMFLTNIDINFMQGVMSVKVFIDSGIPTEKGRGAKTFVSSNKFFTIVSIFIFSSLEAIN